MSKRAEKLLEQMRKSQNGWQYEDLERLYNGFGFDITSGSRHNKVKHPKYHGLYQTILRDGKIPKSYIKDALDMVDKLKQLEAEEEERQDEKGGQKKDAKGPRAKS